MLVRGVRAYVVNADLDDTRELGPPDDTEIKYLFKKLGENCQYVNFLLKLQQTVRRVYDYRSPLDVHLGTDRRRKRYEVFLALAVDH